MIEMGNEKIVTGRPKNHQMYETQEKTVSGLPSQNHRENETQYDIVSGLPSQNHRENETHLYDVNQNASETHSKDVKRMVGWSIPPTVKFTVTPIPKYRIG